LGEAHEKRIEIRSRDTDQYGHINNAVCRLAGLGTSSIRTLEQILTLDGAVAAEAEAVLVARDPGSGRSRPLTDPERTAIGA
jgi:acyl-CoA thioesterase FadM